MAGRDRTPHITIEVERSLQPFKHVEEKARDIFATHAYKENFLDKEKHKDKLQNFDQLEALGPHPLLDRQTNEAEPSEWIHCMIRAKGTENWIRFFMRRDNLYVRGFDNKHQGYEISEPVTDPVTQKTSRPVLLPANYKCELLGWDLPYTDLFDCKDAEQLEELLQEIVTNPDFVFEAICYLSSYVHTEGDSVSEATAKKMLGGTIFHLCEFLRMNVADFPGNLYDKARHWGDICLQMLKWRDRDFNDWITSRVYTKEEKPPKLYNDLKKLIKSEVDALTLIRLVLNRDTKHYEHIVENKRRKPPGGSKKGEGSGSSTAAKKSDSSSSDCRGESFAREVSRLGFRLGAPMEDVDPLPWGRRRVQLLDLRANFEIDWIRFHDWHRPQSIYYRRTHVDGGYGPYLQLVGPKRPIGAYACIGVEFLPTKSASNGQTANKGVTNERGAMMELWKVDNYNDVQPTIHMKEVEGPRDGEKLKISYMLVPDTVNTRVSVKLLLGGEGCYRVTGSIKAWNSAMDLGSKSVHLFAQQTVKVSAGQWIQFPLMVQMLCLPNIGDVDLNVAAYLTLSSCSEGEASEGGGEQGLTVPAHDCFKLSRKVTRQEREVRGNKIAVNVKMSTLPLKSNLACEGEGEQGLTVVPA